MMKEHSKARWMAAVIAALLSLEGCAVEDTIYLQRADVAGPAVTVPLHIRADSGKGRVLISPSFHLQNNAVVDGKASGPVYPQDPPFGDNLRWSMPAFAAGVNVDIPLSRRWAWNFGVDGSGGNGISEFGLSTGLAILFDGDDSRGSLEFGAAWQSIHMDAYSIVEHTETPVFGSPQTTVGYFHDVKSAMPTSWYGSLTLFSTKRDFPVNFFGQIAICSQTIVAFTPSYQVVPVPPLYTYVRSDTRTSTSAAMLIVTPGFYFTLAPRVRLDLGARTMYEFGITSGASRVHVFPMAQCDVAF